MKASALPWSTTNLDKFLTAPAKTIPGTKMVIGVSDAAQRKLIIDYLVAQR
jgi:cytochrome c